MTKSRIIAITSLLALTACGGGGGGGNTLPPAGSNSGTPTIITANTSNPHYLPLSNGNYWQFATGAKLVDAGGGPLVCSCPGNGIAMERIELISANSTAISASFFFTKNMPPNAAELTNLVGFENDSGTNAITIASTVAYPYGVPIMDDNPQVNETWTDGSGAASTITSVGGTLMLSPTSQVVGIAIDQITGSFSPITWGFAHGVGFTSIGVGAQSTSITSFYVNAATSQSTGSKPETPAVTHFSPYRFGDIRAKAAAALKALFQ